MKFLFALLQLFLIFQVVLNLNILAQNQSLFSPNMFYKVTLEIDGNFVLWSTPAKNGSINYNYIWSIETRNKGSWPFYMKLQEDGNLVLFDKDNKGQWWSNTAGQGKAPYTLEMQDDGDVVVKDATPTTIWRSGTAGRK